MVQLEDAHRYTNLRDHHDNSLIFQNYFMTENNLNQLELATNRRSI